MRKLPSVGGARRSRPPRENTLPGAHHCIRCRRHAGELYEGRDRVSVRQQVPLCAVESRVERVPCNRIRGSHQGHRRAHACRPGDTRMEPGRLAHKRLRATAPRYHRHPGQEPSYSSGLLSVGAPFGNRRRWVCAASEQGKGPESIPLLPLLRGLDAHRSPA